MARDAIRSQQLRAAGWRVIRVWESQIAYDLGRVIQHIERAMRKLCSRRGARARTSLGSDPQEGGMKSNFFGVKLLWGQTLKKQLLWGQTLKKET